MVQKKNHKIMNRDYFIEEKWYAQKEILLNISDEDLQWLDFKGII